MKTRKIIVSYLVVAGFQFAWHWFVSTHYKLAEILLRVYLYHAQNSHKGVAGYLDLMLPGILLGLTIGWVGPQTPNWCVISVGIGIVALMPIYTLLLGKDLVYWWPQTTSELVVSFVFEIITAWIVVWVFADAGRWLANRHEAGQSRVR